MDRSKKNIFYTALQRFILSEQQLKNNGYPIFDANNPDTVKINPVTYGGQTVKITRGRMVYACCSGSMPCRNFKTHVYKAIDCTGFVKTMPPTVKAGVNKSSTSQSSKESADETEQTVKNVRKIKTAIRKRSNNLKDLAEKIHEKTVDENSGGSGPEKTESGGSGPENSKTENDSVDLEPSVYSLDTEMVWTTKGNEVASVTVIDMDLKTVFESLVKPKGDVIDYNTEYSGITEENMKNATSDLDEVREKLLDLFSEQTILMGHSLEFDLIGMKIIHYKVVDTSIAYPHKRGPPFKRALKTLAEDYLGKRIQKPNTEEYLKIPFEGRSLIVEDMTAKRTALL